MTCHHGRWAGAVIGLAAGFVVVSGAAEELPDTPRPTIIPLDTGAGDHGRVIKWLRPLRVSLVGEGAAVYRTFVMQILEGWQTTSGHRMAVAEGDEDTDAWIIFGAETQKEALARHTERFAPLYSNEAAMVADLKNEPVVDRELCLSKRGMSTENPHEIVYAIGQVPPYLAKDDTERCILRLLLSALGGGFTTDPNLLLTVWYDSRVKPGMTDDEVQPIRREKTLRSLGFR